jgi:adenine-specific DNA-methyltransferase
MATGIPKTKWQSSPQVFHGNGGDVDVHLSYVGKKSEHEILATPPAICSCLWTDPKDTHFQNRLYYGDNLPILATLLRDPSVCGKVRLIYIDPPYATKSVFQSRNQSDAYTDLLEGAHYIEFIRERLIFLRKLLAEDGSIYVHLDDNMAFLVKAVMDEAFGASNFRNWIVRKKCNPKNYTRRAYGNVADYILFYTKSDNYVWHRPVDPWTEERAQKEYSYVERETGRRYKKVPVHAPGVRNGETGQTWRGMKPPPGKHWQYPPRVLDEMDKRGEIYWSPTGNPRRKIYLDKSDGIPVQDIWLNFRDAHNQNIEVSGYPTEKNPDLLAQIIRASSKEGDIVLDCFSGSGTTLSVASRLGRHWIGLDNSTEAIRATLRRFGKGLKPMGDFVGKPTSDEEDETSEANLPLFEANTISKPQLKSATRHRVIQDFALFAQNSRDGDLDGEVSQWKEWVGAEQTSQVREKRSHYKTKRRKTKLARKT